MSYQEENGTVVLRIHPDSYTKLLMMLGIAGQSLAPEHPLLGELIVLRKQLTDRKIG